MHFSSKFYKFILIKFWRFSQNFTFFFFFFISYNHNFLLVNVFIFMVAQMLIWVLYHDLTGSFIINLTFHLTLVQIDQEKKQTWKYVDQDWALWPP